MGIRARIAYCRNCRARTVWSELSADELEARAEHKRRMAALIETLSTE